VDDKTGDAGPAPSLLRTVLTNGPAVLGAKWYLRKATSVGSRVRVFGRPFVENSGTLIIGDRVRLISTIATIEIAVSAGGRLEIGERTYVNYGTSIGATKLVQIGPRCNIGSHVMMIDNDFHSLEPERRNELPPSAPIVLEENVWLGSRVIVLRGVTIGAHSVVGAGSVVVSDVPPRSVAVGVPARIVRSL
jgi:maltose O-acetyltransferase